MTRAETLAPSPSPAPRRARRRTLRTLGRAASQVAVTLVLVGYLFPFVWMVLTSLKSNGEVFANPPRAVGETLRFDNYPQMLEYIPFLRQLGNSVAVAAGGAAIAVVVSVCAAYAFARFSFRGRDALFLVLLTALMVPQEVVVIPMFQMMRVVQWQDTWQALVLPWAFTVFGTFLLRQFFLNLPLEVEEAARLDGAGRLRVLAQIVVPMARPAIAVLAVFTFLGYWNSFLWPLIIISSSDHATLPLGLQMFQGQNGNQWTLLMAAATCAVVPMVVLILALRRHLVSGIALGGLGGR
ncbi:MAG TPA: carbohydrate ABC transporter permease [Cellulomonas sp.]